MDFISGIKSTICFVLHLSRAPKCTRCLGIYHVLLLPQFNLSSRRIASCGPFSEFHISFESSQSQLSKKPRRNPRGAVIASLRAVLQLSALSSLFRLCFRLHLTSAATNYISEISLTTRFDWSPSQILRCAICLATRHVLLLSLFDVSSHCTVPSAPISAFNTAFGRYQILLSNAPARVLNNHSLCE